MSRIVVGFALIVLVFAGGAALFDEHVAGWDGFLPVEPLDVSSVENPRDARLAIDDAAETLWRSRRGKDLTWTVAFPEPRELCGVWTDTGNSFRLHPLKYTMRLALAPSDPGEPIKSAVTVLFSIWRHYAFEPRPVSRLEIQSIVPGTPQAPYWGLRDVRFLAPGAFHWKSDAYLPALKRVLLPAILAAIWLVLMQWIADRRDAAESRRLD